MKSRVRSLLVAALCCFAPATSFAAITEYHQDLEALVQADPSALSNDGWLVFGNVFDPTGVNYLYGYGPFPAPNPGGGFCAIDAGQGGVEQGAQQLSIYNDYNNLDHALLRRIESNVYREYTVTAENVGQTWRFQFDAKLGNLAGTSTALAFIKTLNPSAGYAMTNFITVTTTAIPATWNTYTIDLPIDAGLVGQLFQIGFLTNATNYEPSGVFYDNLHLFVPTVGVGDAPRAQAPGLAPAYPNPFRSATRIDYAVARPGPVDVSVFDITGRRVATLYRGTAAAGAHSVSWDGRTTDGQPAPAGVYRAVLQTAAGRESRSLVLAR